jgi:hypothetical protein
VRLLRLSFGLSDFHLDDLTGSRSPYKLTGTALSSGRPLQCPDSGW